jgi:hypothetical protein
VRKHAVLLIAAASAAALGACSLVDLNGLTGGTPADGGGSDGNVDVSSEAGGANDGAPPSDSGSAGDTASPQETGTPHDSGGPETSEGGPAESGGVDGPIDAPPDTPSSDGPPVVFQLVHEMQTGTLGTSPTTVNVLADAGHLLVLGVYYSFNTATVAVSDSLQSNWTSVPAHVNTGNCLAGNGIGVQLWYAPASVAGTHVLSVSVSTVLQGYGFFLIEYAGPVTSNPLEVSGGVVAPGPSTAMDVQLTTTGSHDLLVGLFADCNGAGSIIAGPAFQAQERDTHAYAMYEDDLAGVGAGVHDVNATLPNAPDPFWAATAAAFRGQ